MTAATEFLDGLARLYARAGCPPAAGRLLGTLLLSAKPRTLDEMAARLGISKSAASANARLLEGQGVVDCSQRPGDRHDYYTVSERLCERQLEQYLRALDAFGECLAAGVRAPEARDGPLPDRFDRLRDMNRRISSTLRQVLLDVRSP